MQSSEFIKAFAAFFAIMNPFLTLPIFLALTSGFSVDQFQVAAAARWRSAWALSCCTSLAALG